MLPPSLQHSISPPDKVAEQAALSRQQQLTKPPGSLGLLEQLACRFAGFQGRAIPVLTKIIIRVFAADHGIATRGVSAFPQTVTAQMVANFCSGGAAISVLARRQGADFAVVNMGCLNPVADHVLLTNSPIAAATADFSEAAAMSVTQLQAALTAGVQALAADDTISVFVGGEMGIGNTTSAAAILAIMLDLPAARVTGHGTGITDTQWALKCQLIDQARTLHLCTAEQPLEVLRCVGGFEIAALVGAYLGAAQRGIPSLVDGFISTVAALVAVAIDPAVRDWLLFAHRSTEAGHQLALSALDATPLLALDMRLGEGSGAALALDIVNAALCLHRQMASFTEAGVSNG
ncbi:MAG TPA: nicotinate-nucleotide--dimethylbenzimidazole phosphoribosyltransferase [Cellvibrionaceae bacterium]